MQVIENRSLIEGEITDVRIGGDPDHFRIRLSSVQPVDGYRNLLTSHTGGQVEVIVVGGAGHPQLHRGDHITAELSLSRPGRTVMHLLSDVS